MIYRPPSQPGYVVEQGVYLGLGGCPARAEARDSTPGRGRSLLEVVAPGQRFPLLRGQYDELLVGGAVSGDCRSALASG